MKPCQQKLNLVCRHRNYEAFYYAKFLDYIRRVKFLTCFEILGESEQQNQKYILNRQEYNLLTLAHLFFF